MEEEIEEDIEKEFNKDQELSPIEGMVSQRAIVSRSRDDLQYYMGASGKNFNAEDQWFSKEKLYKVSFGDTCLYD